MGFTPISCETGRRDIRTLSRPPGVDTRRRCHPISGLSPELARDGRNPARVVHSVNGMTPPRANRRSSDCRRVPGLDSRDGRIWGIARRKITTAPAKERAHRFNSGDANGVRRHHPGCGVLLLRLGPRQYFERPDDGRTGGVRGFRGLMARWRTGIVLP